MNYKKEFIDFLLDSEVLLFGKFTTKSGRKSPYFINAGKYESTEQIMKLGQYYARYIKGKIDAGEISADANVIFGPAYKGIPLAITTSIALFKEFGLNFKYCFNRKESKDHGEGGMLIGHQPESGDKIIVVDDVITAGTATREIMPMIQSYDNVKVEALVVSVDRMERGFATGEAISAMKEIEKVFAIKTFSIVNIMEILDYVVGDDFSSDISDDFSDDFSGDIEAYIQEYCIV